MASSAEIQSGSEKKGGLLGFYKRINKLSAAVLGIAGVVFESPVLLGLAAIDIAQVAIVKWFENRKKTKKASKIGHMAMASA